MKKKTITIDAEGRFYCLVETNPKSEGVEEVNDISGIHWSRSNAEDEFEEFSLSAPEFYLCEVIFKPVEKISMAIKREKVN